MATKFLGQSKYVDSYKKGDIAMPTEKSSENADNPLYYLRWAEFIFAQYAGGFCQYGVGGVTNSGKSFEMLRQYALAQQDNRIYKDLLDECDPNKTEGYMNINWDNVALMPKFRDLLRGKMMGVDFEVNTQAVDETSNKSRAVMAGKMKMLTNPHIQAMIKTTGQQPQGVKLPQGIETPEDVEMLQTLGGIRLQYELFLQDAIEYSKYESNWDTVKDRWIDDAIDLNVCAAKVYLEDSSRIVKIRYVNPANLVCRATTDPAHKDVDYAGELRRMTISELRIESGLSEEQIFEIAEAYKGFKKNSWNTFNGDTQTMMQRSGASTNRGVNQHSYNNFEVDVLDFSFIGKEVERYVMGVRKDGLPIYDKVGDDSQLGVRDLKKGKEIDETEVEFVYTCKWVIGTNIIFNCSKEYGIVRQKKSGVHRAQLPYIIYSDRTPSIVERCIPHIDDIQLAILKKRNLLAKMAPGPRIALDKSLLRSSVDIGGKSYSMLEMVGLYPKTGLFVYESKSEFDGEHEGSNRPPMTFLPSGIVEDYQMLSSDVQEGIMHIRNVTGINEVADGSTQQGDMLVRVMEGLQSATNNATKPVFRLYSGLYENIAKYTGCKWQVAVIDGDIDINYVPINDNVVKNIKLSGDLYDYDFGIKIILIPSEQDRQMLLQDILAKRQNQEIAPQDYIVLYNMIRGGDFKKAQLFMAKSMERQSALKQQQSVQQMQAQSQAQAQAAMAIEQEKTKTMQMEFQLKGQLIVLQAQEERKTLQLQAQLQAQGLGVAANLESQKEMVSKVLEHSTMEQPANLPQQT